MWRTRGAYPRGLSVQLCHMRGVGGGGETECTAIRPSNSRRARGHLPKLPSPVTGEMVPKVEESRKTPLYTLVAAVTRRGCGGKCWQQGAEVGVGC